MPRPKKKQKVDRDPLGGRKPGGDDDFSLGLEEDDDAAGDAGSLSDDGLWDEDDEEGADGAKPTPKARAKESRELVDQAIAIRRERERAVVDRLDMGFFFSVVFRTRKERDAWLVKYGLTLRSDDYVTVDDLEEGIAASK